MTQPAASESWNLFADGYAETIAEFWDKMVKGRSPIQMMKTGLGEVLWCEKDALALNGR